MYFSVVLVNIIVYFLDFTLQDRFYRQINNETESIPEIVAYTTTCICIPPQAKCESVEIRDGTGLVDVRIVTNPSSVPSLKCDFELIPCCQIGPYRCGVRYPPPPKSTQPSPGQSEFGAYPWLGAILTKENVYLGSGVLIDRINILTVAHKVYNVPISSVKIRLGDWDALGEDEPIPSEEFQVSNVIIHPQYNPSNLFNDIAVVKLTKTVNLGKVPTISTACLKSENFVGATCYVTGWGKDEFGPEGKVQSIQREVAVPINKFEDCQTELRKTRLGENFVFNSESFLCAGGEEGKDACTGDGGAPLVCNKENRWIVAGLVAWGIGCGTAGVPGVYVNVRNFLPWIQQTISSANSTA